MNIFERIIQKITAILEMPAPGAYSSIREQYKYEIKNAILGYLIDDSTNPTKYANQMKRAMVNAFGPAFDRGYLDGGGDPSEMRSGDSAWLNNKQTTEMGFIDQLFERLKEMKKEGPADDSLSEVDDRAESYADTLDGVYAEGKLRGAGNVMLTFGGDDGEESCPECRKWKGKRHAASFWIIRGLIPGQPGNQNFSCRGYNCRHYLYDDKGEVWAGH